MINSGVDSVIVSALKTQVSLPLADSYPFALSLSQGSVRTGKLNFKKLVKKLHAFMHDLGGRRR
jgi:hypothetical protein